MATNSDSSSLVEFNKIGPDIEDKEPLEHNLQNSKNEGLSINIEQKKGTTSPKKTDLKKSSKRCNHLECRKRLKLTDITCRCGYKFCSSHRYSDHHNCSIDYKALGRERLDKENPPVNSVKLTKI